MFTLIFRNLVQVFLLILAFSLAAFAQTAELKSAVPGKISNQILNSKLMAREMPYNLYLPANYDEKSQKDSRFAVVYLLHGLSGHFDNWQVFAKLEAHAKNFKFIIVMPEGDNGWYTDSATISNDKYESYIVKELIPEIDKKFRTKALRQDRAIAGLSMGGYGALKFGFKYPDLFVLAGSFSGALGITDVTDKNSEPWVSKSVMSVYGEAESETRKSNDLFALVKLLSADQIKKLPFIYQDCGTEDFLIKNNRDFVALLAEKKIPHEYRELPGVHDWKFWDSQVQEFLRQNDRFVSK
jgi:putative tributyrin esterase